MRGDGKVMRNIYSIRADNLRSLIKRHGSTKVFCEKHQILSASEISQILSETHRRNLGPKVARRIEETLNLRSNWMDEVHLSHTPNELKTVIHETLLEFIGADLIALKGGSNVTVLTNLLANKLKKL